MTYAALVISLVLIIYLSCATVGEQLKPAPKTLIWTYSDFSELRANARAWHDTKGIDGFIFCFVNRNNAGPVRWDSGPEKIVDLYRELPETIQALHKAGIDSNFVHANMDDPAFDWFDQPRIDRMIATFRALGKTAKETGCKGVAIDTESYSPKVWDPSGYPADKQAELNLRIRQTGAAVMDAILSEYPESEIIVLPEGAYIDLKNAPGGLNIYHYWMQFINGLMSSKPKQGITVLTECGYFWKDPIQITLMHGELNASMVLESEDPVYWLSKCSIGHGAAVMGGGKEGKQSWQTPTEFGVQWKMMSELSPKYRFVFAYESGFAHYPPGATKLSIKAFGIPLPRNADAYFKVLRNSRNPEFARRH